MKSTIRVRVETISFAYVTLHDAAEYSLQEARESEEGRFFKSLAAMLYSAFSLEAYLNHLGAHEIPKWGSITRYRSPRQKLDILSAKGGYSPDFAKRPFDTFEKVFVFRKMIVHGKTEVVKTDEIRAGNVGEQPEFPRTDWEKSTTLENAELFVVDSASIIRKLHPIFGNTTDPFFTEWKSSWAVDPADGNSGAPT